MSQTSNAHEQARQALQQPARFKWWECAIWALAFAAPLVFPAHALLVSEISILALFALSLDLILGYAGIVSLGHAAFFGVGAYSAALFAKWVLPDPTAGLLVAVLCAALLGVVCSLTVLRGSDLTRLMVTMGVSLILWELANKLDWLTGGADGLQGVVMSAVLGRFEFDLSGQTAAWYSLVVSFVVFVLARRFVQSPLGAGLQAIRDNALRAQSIGIHVHGKIGLVYVVAAAIAGLAGALQAQTTGFASLDVFAFDRSADLMLVLVIGGAGWLWGGLMGAVVFKLLHSVVSFYTPQYWPFWMGLFLVVLVLVGRERLLHPRLWFGK